MNEIIIGDSATVLPTLADNSVQLVVTSPPYDDLRTYGSIKRFAWEDFTVVAKELYRVLCDGGVLCWNVGDSVVGGSETLTSAKQAIYFKDVCGFRVHDTMIYEKVNFGNPERTRYHQLFEYVFILSKGVPRCFNPIKDKPNIYAGSGTFGRNTGTQRDGSITERKRSVITEFGMRGNVWRGNTAGQETMCEGSKHPAPMPFWLARDLIQSWSNSGDLVLDPFGGSGTTGKAAEFLGRKWILIDINPEYAVLQRERTAQQGMVFN